MKTELESSVQIVLTSDNFGRESVLTQLALIICFFRRVEADGVVVRTFCKFSPARSYGPSKGFDKGLVITFFEKNPLPVIATSRQMMIQFVVAGTTPTVLKRFDPIRGS